MSTQGVPNLHVPRLAWVMALIALLVLGSILGQGRTEAQQVVTIDPGPGTQYISPDLWGVLHRQANGATNLVANLDLALGYDTEKETDLSAAIVAAGGSHTKANRWLIPTNQVLGIIQRPEVLHAEIYRVGIVGQTGQPSQLNDVLTNVVAALRDGVPANQAVLYGMFVKDGSIVVWIDSPDATTNTKVKKWLSDRNIYVPELNSYDDDGHSIGVLLPATQIVPLMQAFSTVSLSADGHAGQNLPLTRTRWSNNASSFESDLLTAFVKPTSTSQGAAQERSASGSSAPSSTSTNETEFKAKLRTDTEMRQRIHGAYDWHQANRKGNGVKVGIIDWGFRDLEDNAELEDISRSPHVTSPIGNAFCQSLARSTWPYGRTIEGNSTPCKPFIGVFGLGRPMNHGVSVAELIKDMAPDADIVYAQANSPRQVYRAATWLNARNVDVIVHAAGWTYDGPGDGTSDFEVRDPNGANPYRIDAPLDNEDLEHAKERYVPSPLETVDHFVKDSSGPVWINAAGNMEKLTIFIDDPELYGGNGDYAGYLKLTKGISEANDRTGKRSTCQLVPKKGKTIYGYSLRWADNETTATKDLELWVGPKSANPNGALFGLIKPGFAKTKDVQQLDDTKPFRRVIKMSVDTEVDNCLRIEVEPNSSGKRVAPEWVQVQIISSDYENGIGSGVDGYGSPHDGTGHSIVNPASSNNDGLMAMAAKDLGTTDWELMDYSSGGPVFEEDDNILTDTPERIKPDATAGSWAVTHTKWNQECGPDKTLAQCGKKMYFGGTSAATSHTGGLTALAVEWFDTVGAPYGPDDVADYLRKVATPKVSGTHPNNQWGHGFLELPCPSDKISAPPRIKTGSLTASDCKLDHFRTKPNRYVDYYTFRLSTRSQLQIELKATGGSYSTTIDPYLFVVDGLYTEEPTIKFSNDDFGGNNNSRLVQTFAPGVYTVGVSTASERDAGPYILEFKVLCSSNCGTPEPPGSITASLSDSPNNEDFRNDGNWHTFNVNSSVPVKVVVNPSNSSNLLDISTTNSGTACPPTADKNVSRSNGNRVYIAGCDTGDAKIEVRKASDNALLATYTPTVSHGATLYPDPTTVDFEDDEEWHSFTVRSNARVKVEVNPSNSINRLDVSTSSSSVACPPSSSDYRSRANGETIYIAACSDGTARIRLLRESDDRVLNVYTIRVEEKAITPTASLSPNPSSTTIKEDENWHRFTVSANVPVKVRVNPTGSDLRLDVATSSNSSACPASRSDTVSRSNGNAVYIAGCVAGTSKIQLLQASDNTVLATYSVAVNIVERAWLTPSPSTVTIKNNGTWHRFTVKGNITTKVVVNPTGSSLRLDIARSTGTTACPASRSDSYLRRTNDYIYIAGCSTGSARIQLLNPWTDDVLATYNITVQTNPSASLSPLPSSKTFYDNGAWHKFTVNATVPVKVIVNPTGSQRRLEITNISTTRNFCPGVANDTLNMSNGDFVYLAGCSHGSAKVNVVARSNNAVLASYSINVQQETSTPTATVCKPVTNLLVNRRTASATYLTWSNPTGGLTATGRKIEVRRWVNSKWTHERFINEPASRTYAWHLGQNRTSYYSYRVRSECSGNATSDWTAWRTVGPYRGISGASGNDLPTPTPGVPVPHTPVPGDEDSPVPPDDDSSQ